MSEAGKTPALELRGISRSYGDGDHQLQVLQEASLAVQQGEMVALVAPSGAGKSTLLHACGLLERADRGDVLIAGEATSKLSDRRRTRLRRNAIGFIYQFHHLLPEFSARENLMIPQMIAGLSQAKAGSNADEFLEFMKIADRADHRPSELSGGEQQRVAIARAMVNRPVLLLADEPTGNLDPDTADHVFGLLRDLVRSTGLASLIATHNHDLAGQMDRCVTLEQGKVEEIIK